jgi:hypothetical protein
LQSIAQFRSLLVDPTQFVLPLIKLVEGAVTFVKVRHIVEADTLEDRVVVDIVAVVQAVSWMMQIDFVRTFALELLVWCRFQRMLFSLLVGLLGVQSCGMLGLKEGFGPE